MKPCIYGEQSYPEGATICVNGRELRCTAGEWTETGHACTASKGSPETLEVDYASGNDTQSNNDPGAVNNAAARR